MVSGPASRAAAHARMADILEMDILHMVTSTPNRTPNFTLFANADYFLGLCRGTFALDPGHTVKINGKDTPLLLLNGKTVNLDFSLVDRLSSVYKKSVATIFVRQGEDFVRVSTSLKKEDGSRAVGTVLDAASPAPLTRKNCLRFMSIRPSPAGSARSCAGSNQRSSRQWPP